jgi:hypothetical protein
MDHWSVNARRWALLGPPLRPCAEDTAVAAGALARRGDRPTRGLVLGVTPEFVTLPWPAGSLVVAADRVRPMIDAVFSPGPGRHAVVADWLALPVPAGAIDLALGDGCLSTLPYPTGYRAFAAELVRVLRGELVLRVFVAPDRAETVADVVADLAHVASFDALKWRLGAALATADRNVPLVAIHAAFEAAFPDRDALASRTGWRRAVIDHIDVYRDAPARYSFPTLAEVRATLAEHLVEVGCETPGYPLGARFPTLILTARNDQAPDSIKESGA